MKRFNLLIVNGNNIGGGQRIKALDKVERRNLVFKVNNMSEAAPLLNRLKIDVVLVDLDRVEFDLKALRSTHPELVVFGVTKTGRSTAIPNEYKGTKVLKKEELETTLAAELKLMRKERFPLLAMWSRNGSRSDSRSDFKNFNQLVAAN